MTVPGMAALPPEGDAILTSRSEAIGKIYEESNKLTADLYDKYAAALEREMQNYQKGGDLDNLLLVTKEQKSARELRKMADVTSPVIESYRNTLKESLAKFEASEKALVLAVDTEAVKSLIALRTQLTQTGAVDAAVAVDQQIKAIQGVPEGGASIVPEMKPTVMPKGQVPGAEMFKSSEPWVGDYVLEPKRYVLREKLALGRDGKKHENQKSFFASLYCPPGCRIEKGEVLVDQGLMQAEGAFFKETLLKVDLGGEFKAKASLFEDSGIQKGGYWFVDYFASKWTFDNCVFTGEFVRDWKVKNVGVKVTNCTFYGITFSPITYQKDAGKEVTNEWMTITGCKFVNCKIPESFLLATRDCVFEDCEFLPADLGILIETPIKTRIFVNQRRSLPTLGLKREVIVSDVMPQQKAIGASLKHRRVGKSIEF